MTPQNQKTTVTIDTEETVAKIRYFTNLVLKNRSTRRFDESCPIGIETLQLLVFFAKNSPCSANSQHIRYKCVNDPILCNLIDSTINWAKFLPEATWHVPGQRPPAFILLTSDPQNRLGIYQYDIGIAAQTICLGATNLELNCCIIGSFDHKKVKSLLSIPENLQSTLLIAVGKSNETTKIVQATSDLKYYRDEDDSHCVPKKSLREVLL